MGRPKKDKNEFADLPVGFKDELEGKDEVGIRALIAQVALDDVTLKLAQADDVDLQEKKLAAKAANSGYAAGFKENKLKIKYMRRLLSDGGKKV